MKKFAFLIFIGLLLGSDAMAQSGGGAATGLCQVAEWLKQIVAGGAIIAVMLFVINSFFVKSSVVGDIIMYVIIGCTIASVSSFLIGLTGLTTSCSV